VAGRGPGTCGYARGMESYRRGNLTFDVRDSGPPDGEAVVLLHGFPQDSTSWLTVEPLLHAAGLRTLAPDQRGYSPGARPPGRRAYVSSELAADVVALLDAAGLSRAHVVGHDWGGSVAWSVAGSFPSRFSTVTVLSTPHPAALIRVMTSSSQGLKSWYMGAMQVPFVPEQLLARVMSPMLRRSGLPAESAQHYADRFRFPSSLTGPVNWYRALPFSLREGAGHRVGIPATYVWGAHDPFLGRAAAEATRAYVKADYDFVELKAGHWLPETHAAEVAQAVISRVSAT
jgi:pimeloyl-ACP methyl ester carboxylesterase